MAMEPEGDGSHVGRLVQAIGRQVEYTARITLTENGASQIEVKGCDSVEVVRAAMYAAKAHAGARGSAPASGASSGESATQSAGDFLRSGVFGSPVRKRDCGSFGAADVG